ncbi:polysaccharide biosynthesis/export family protein [Pseudodonghicola flavimaris]|uniref:Polysaccharide biosynthesis/export family protein n=1 Tax=Pseudodonghicola flavimaris TaxID=3050036 RepID=A0ABT7F843_9RHOB|nr:polysaccharide biosynthesis/export family protein [Pseudodonghicola flavimaris]MDK3020788.1 polysaccharide biosynthesis/export family protein [Pseudodonghicola flavimaris]
MRHAFILLLILGLAGLTSACAKGRLPGGAPVREEVLKQSSDETPEFAVYEVSRAFLPTVSQWPVPTSEPRQSWIGASQGPKTQIIQPGDRLDIRIWDSSDNSLLTTAEQKETRLEQVKVSSSGTIFMPYVGEITVAGQTPEMARSDLQQSLEVIVPSAQVQLNMSEGRANSVDLVGGVSAPGSYPMPDRNYTVLSLLAAGGGVKDSLRNPQIRLMRGSAIYGTSVETLLKSPRLDTRLRGGDRVFVEEDSRYFLSFGAAGSEDLHRFTKDEISAMDAVSIMGGVNDGKADPQGLLILREYPASAVLPGVRGPRQERVVFTLNLTSADGLFSARKFQIEPGDLVVATESPINDTLTIANIVGNFFGVFSRASNAF